MWQVLGVLCGILEEARIFRTKRELESYLTADSLKNRYWRKQNCLVSASIVTLLRFYCLIPCRYSVISESATILQLLSKNYFLFTQVLYKHHIQQKWTSHVRLNGLGSLVPSGSANALPGSRTLCGPVAWKNFQIAQNIKEKSQSRAQTLVKYHLTLLERWLARHRRV